MRAPAAALPPPLAPCRLGRAERGVGGLDRRGGSRGRRSGRLAAATRLGRSAAEEGAAHRHVDGVLVVAAPRVLGLALLEDREERRGDEDRGVGPGPDPDEEREGEVLERVAAEEPAARRSGRA